jgi:hypothetical protein
MTVSRRAVILAASALLLGVVCGSPAASAAAVVPELDPASFDARCVAQGLDLGGTLSGTEATSVTPPGSGFTPNAWLTVEISTPGGAVDELIGELTDYEFGVGAGTHPWGRYRAAAIYTPLAPGSYSFVATATWEDAQGQAATTTRSGSFTVDRCVGRGSGSGRYETPLSRHPNNWETFSFNVADDAGVAPPRGKLEHKTHRTPTRQQVHVKSTAIAGVFVDGNSVRIAGPCTVNGAPGYTFVVEAVDNGADGRLDTYAITVEGVMWLIPSHLTSGNIKVPQPLSAVIGVWEADTAP